MGTLALPAIEQESDETTQRRSHGSEATLPFNVVRKKSARASKAPSCTQVAANSGLDSSLCQECKSRRAHCDSSLGRWHQQGTSSTRQRWRPAWCQGRYRPCNAHMRFAPRRVETPPPSTGCKENRNRTLRCVAFKGGDGDGADLHSEEPMLALKRPGWQSRQMLSPGPANRPAWHV
jgi:hypothetical protein